MVTWTDFRYHVKTLRFSCSQSLLNDLFFNILTFRVSDKSHTRKASSYEIINLLFILIRQKYSCHGHYFLLIGWKLKILEFSPNPLHAYATLDDINHHALGPFVSLFTVIFKYKCTLSVPNEDYSRNASLVLN